MKQIVLAALLLAFAYIANAQQQYYCYPSSVASADSLYVSFDTKSWKYSVPDLNLKLAKTYSSSQHLCGPATLNNNLATFATSNSNTASIDIKTSDLSVAATRNSAAPYPPSQASLTGCFTYSGSNFCFVRDSNANKTYVQRKNGNTVVESLQLPIPDGNAYYFYYDADIQGRIHLATNTGFYRGTTELQYYAIATGPLRIVRGPVALPHTASSGCPTEPAGCAVDVLLQGTFNVRNDIVSYLWSIKTDAEYQVNIVSYDARCNSFKTVRLGSSLASASRCSSSTTAAPTRNCWTCPAGFVHWYDIQGYPEPADKCACVVRPSSTVAPTRNCWTCPAGFVHWYDIQGYPEPSDKCACVVRPSSTTAAPTRNCWTCPAGFVHWYDIQGYPEPSDKCACVVRPSSTTAAPTRNCWTCPAGYVHWYDIQGHPEPADKCACVPRPTQAPTRNCWTCPAGFVHWYDIQGYPEPSDKCACVRQQSRLASKKHL